MINDNRYGIYNEDDFKKANKEFEIYKLLNSQSLVNLAKIFEINKWNFKSISNEIRRLKGKQLNANTRWKNSGVKLREVKFRLK